MLTFEDLHVARLVREQKLVPPDVLPRLMADLDGLPGAPGLAPRLLEQRLVEADAMRSVVAAARRQVGLEADKIYTDVALEKNQIDAERLDALLTKTMVGGRIGAKLVSEGLLTAEQDAAVIAVARAKLQAREKELLEKERAQLTEAILAEPTLHLQPAQRAVRRPNPSSGAVRVQEEAILAEPTLHLRKEELGASSQGAEETVKHTGVLPLPGAPADSEDTKKHHAVLPLPGVAPAARKADAPLEVSHDATSAAASSTPTPTGTVAYEKGEKPPQHASLAGKTLKVLSGYEIEKELGRGAMGVVYLARETQLKRSVALKVLPKSDNPESAQRFMREARAIAALDHPGIVPVYQYGEADGNYFIAMKCIDGRPLKQVAAKPLPAKRAAAILEQVARAMGYAHEQGVIHRDLKPANILVEAGDKAWVVDFGIAKLDTEMTMTQAGEIMGTPAYMSPEQTLQLPVDARTDVYSLGAVLYAIVCGQPPFVGANAMEVLPRVATEDPKKPSELRKDLHRDLETIVLVAMMKEPERRYPTALDLAEDLRRFQAGEPISGQRPGAVYLARRWVRRHAIPLAALVVALVAGGGAYMYRGARADEEKQKVADREREDRRQRIKEKLDAIDALYSETQKAVAVDDLIAKTKKLGELLEAADAVDRATGASNAAPNERLIAWHGTVEKLVHKKASERRAAAKKCFDEGSGERALTALKDAVALEPGSPDNKALEELFKRPIVAVRWKAPGTQLQWARLDADLHQSSDWQVPPETTPERATFPAPETKWVRVRATFAGRMETIVDLEVKPGTVYDLPPAPLAIEDSKTMAFVAPVAHLLGGRAKGAVRGTPEQKTLAAPGFLVDRAEVSRNAFLAFVKAKGYDRKELWSERGRIWLDERRAAGPLTGPKDCDLSETGRGEEPVTGVSFYEAEAFATFVGKQLPTQDQLEAAARGTLGGSYPWGNRYAKEFFQPGQQTPRAPRSSPLDVSPIGCFDLAGNVREWTCEPRKDWASEQSGAVVHLVKGAFVMDPEAEALQWAKGAACTARDPKERAADLGFRCVRNLKASDF